LPKPPCGSVGILAELSQGPDSASGSQGDDDAYKDQPNRGWAASAVAALATRLNHHSQFRLCAPQAPG
jgi:hypothetical protein